MSYIAMRKSVTRICGLFIFAIGSAIFEIWILLAFSPFLSWLGNKMIRKVHFSCSDCESFSSGFQQLNAYINDSIMAEITDSFILYISLICEWERVQLFILNVEVI